MSTALYRNSWVHSTADQSRDAEPLGSVFNIGFSPTDAFATAVYANGAFTIHDRRQSSEVCTMHNAHSEGANCVTFLNDSTFLTCSDDTTIKVWDLRKLRTKVAVLKGHRGWVKNIEYDAKSGLLFSIAFHDGVRAWAMNEMDRYEGGEADNLVIPLQDPVRLRIAADGSRMFLSLRKNLCIVYDKFDGRSLSEATDDVTYLIRCRQPKTAYKRRVNCPSIHVMSSLKEDRGFRSVLSASFHPSGNFIGLRHLDIKDQRLCHELITLYDLSAVSMEPYHPVIQGKSNYLKYLDESSEVETVEFIKEISFNSDGRVIASPHACGVRLLAMDGACTSPDAFMDQRFYSAECALHSPDFEVVQVLQGHGSPVLTCCFAHHDMLLATGCFEGHVRFHQPHP